MPASAAIHRPTTESTETDGAAGHKSVSWKAEPSGTEPGSLLSGSSTGVSMVPVRGRRRWIARTIPSAALSVLALACGGEGVAHQFPVSPDVSAATASASDDVETPVNWLVAHQSADGGWEAAGFHRWQMGERFEEGESRGPGKAHNDVAVTALASLRHLLAGYRPRDQGPFGAAVAWGLHALCEQQRADGCVSDPSQPLRATNHALAAWALAEAAYIGIHAARPGSAPPAARLAPPTADPRPGRRDRWGR